MKIFAINLPKDVARRASLDKQGNGLGLSIEWVVGVYGRELAPDELRAAYRSRLARQRLGREMTPAEIGCALSHISIYRRIVTDKIPCALILEDDAVLDERLPLLLDALQHHLSPASPAVVLLSPASGQPGPSLPLYGCFTLQPYKAGFYTHAYVVTLAGARALLRALFPVGNVADCWPRLARHRVVDIYVTLPEAAVQDQQTFGSSTTEESRQGAVARSIVARLLFKCRRAFWLALDWCAAQVNRRLKPYAGIGIERDA